MIRGVILISVLLTFVIGCDTPQSHVVDYKPTASAAITLAVLRKPVNPDPSPAPDAGDKCQDCNGTGKVGDGTVFVKCKACNGTGKIGSAPVDATVEKAPVVDQVAEVCQSGCENGQCQKCSANCPQCVSTSEVATEYVEDNCSSGNCSSGSYSAPRLFRRWRR